MAVVAHDAPDPVGIQWKLVPDSTGQRHGSVAVVVVGVDGIEHFNPVVCQANRCGGGLTGTDDGMSGAKAGRSLLLRRGEIAMKSQAIGQHAGVHVGHSDLVESMQPLRGAR